MADLYGVRTLYYNLFNNCVYDNDGRIIYDIFRIISPSLFYLWRRQGGIHYLRPKRYGYIIYRFVFPFDNEDYDGYFDN